MKISHIFLAASLLVCASACSSDDPKDPSEGEPGGNTPGKPSTESVAVVNTQRAISIIDAAVTNYFDPQSSSMVMARKYNPFTGNRSSEVGSVWMYTSSIEAVNATMIAMKDLKDNGKPELYNANWDRYKTLLDKLIDNLDFYAGTFTLTSYTGTNTWTVYAVNRASGKGSADVTGVLNVYDDQQWLVRELIEAYRVTGNAKYLEKAEYLTAYVLDGWDCTLNSNGNEHGGITWGPGYTTKHSCSNGPMVAPLAWLSDIYKGKADKITYKLIDTDKKRYEVTESKYDYYLKMAVKVYDWQKRKLYNSSNGVFYDMLGANGGIAYETINGVRYRANNPDTGATGKYYSYNTGTMISGAAAIASSTGDSKYISEAQSLSQTSFNHFAQLGVSLSGYYSFNLEGFSPWFNGVLMRGWAEAYSVAPAAADGLKAFQQNLDYGYSHFLESDMLPVNLLAGWSRDRAKCDTEAMFTFVHAAEYAVLASYELKK